MLRTPLRAIAVCALAAIAAVSLPAQSLAILSPSADGVANDLRPTFRWVPHASAVGYRLQVYDDAFRLVVDQTVGPVTSATIGVDLVNHDVYHARYDALDSFGTSIDRSGLHRFKVIRAPAWLPRLDVVTRDPVASLGGYRLVNLLDVRPPNPAKRIPALMLVNEHGEIVWYYRAPVQGMLQAPKVLPNGNLLYVQQKFTAVPPEGRAVEMTWNGEIVWQSPASVYLHHDISVGPGGNYAGLHWEWREYAGNLYEGDGITVFDRFDGSVLWSWSIFDHFDPITTPTAEQNNGGLSGVGGDWSHSNAAHWDPARSMFWMSVRHFDSLVGIDYPSGNVRVVVGKLGLGGVGLMSHQHAPEVQPDGTILLFDNGNSHVPPHTRVVRIAFDENAASASIVEQWVDTPSFFDFAVGDADMLPNGNMLVTAGVSGRLIELKNVAGNWGIVWEGRLTLRPRWWMYRAEWVPLERIDRTVLPFGGPLWSREFRW